MAGRRPLIGIDGSRLGTARPTGTENYSHEITRHLLDLDLPVRWRIYLNATADSDLAREWSAGAEVRPIPSPRLWTHRRLSMEMMRRDAVLLFVPSHVVPIIHPSSVVTIHDLGYRWFPNAHPSRQRLMLDLATRWNARAARHVIAPSATTRDDLVRFHGIDASMVTVVHHGVSDRFGGVSQERIGALRESLAITGPYVLTVGTIQPRKNLDVLTRAVARLNNDGVACTLVVAGKRGWLADRVLDDMGRSDLGSSLRLLDYLDDANLPALYAGAACYVQPSLFEGFGMPVVEAMASGVPVLVANTSCLPEIAGDGAGLFDPHDVVGLAAMLGAILSTPERRREMAAKARDRSRHFSWRSAAEQTAGVLMDAVD